MPRTALVVLVALLCAAGARAQDSSGKIDTRESIDTQIRHLEQLVGGDIAAEKQAVTLRWLADLYASIGQLDRAAGAFEQILVFFPGDAATSNAYAAMLLDQRHDPAGAEAVLARAIEWSRASATPPPFLGRTYALEARALLELGRRDDALQAADRAVSMLDEDAAEDAVRVRARCLADLGRRDDARATYLSLIGTTGDSNPDDDAALIALLSASKTVDAGAFDATVAGAVADARRARADAARAEGAKIVELQGEGGVRLEATLRRGKSRAAILFVPDLGGRRSAFTPYAQLFTSDGVTTLTVDPRGHGDSRTDSIPSYGSMPERQRERLASDVATAWRYLRDKVGVPVDGIAIVVEGGACTTVEQAIHEHGVVAAVVHLSPLFTADDRDLTAALSFRPPKPMLAVASDEDAFAMRSLWLLDEAGADTSGSDRSGAPPSVTTRVFRFSGHGVELLRDPANFAVVSSWTRKAIHLPD
jgi:tetratricopeptide (TPR) repeat protein